MTYIRIISRINFFRCYMWKFFLSWLRNDKINIHSVQNFEITYFIFEYYISKRNNWYGSNSPSRIDHLKYTILAASTITLDDTFHHYFKDSFFEHIICEYCTSVSSVTMKSTFTVCRILKQPPSFLKIILQTGTFDMVDVWAINNEYNISIPFLIKIPSWKKKITYTILSLIIHDSDSLECGHYTSDVFDGNIGIWWHCDNDDITEIIDLPENTYTRYSHK